VLAALIGLSLYYNNLEIKDLQWFFILFVILKKENNKNEKLKFTF
jgi:hypothetical protein